MKTSAAIITGMVLLGLILMPGTSAVADDTITASQFKGLIALLSHLDQGKATLVAVQGSQTIEVTEFALMKQISASGIKTTFFLRDDKTGSRKQIAIYGPSETGKTMSRPFWGLVCGSAGSCTGCTDLFGVNPCR
jgi:hypothetical protein